MMWKKWNALSLVFFTKEKFCVFAIVQQLKQKQTSYSTISGIRWYLSHSCGFHGTSRTHRQVHNTNLTLDLSSARVKDTLGHTSTPVFSVDCCLLCFFTCHANWFQISRYGVNPVRSRPSGSSGAWVHLPSRGLLWYTGGLPCVTHVPAISIFFPWWWGPFFVVSSDFVCLHCALCLSM